MMEFRISDTFTTSLAKLANEEQKAVKTTTFDLQVNPSQPGMQFHKLAKSKDPNFWSIRAGSDLRLIVHRTAESLLLCYVGHHDDAYRWAERRKLEVHPKTGAAQLVEIRELVKEVTVPAYVSEEHLASQKPLLFAGIAEEEFLTYGVPPEWIADVRRADEDSILELADHLPAEAAEALLDLATGSKPIFRTEALQLVNPFDHPDAQRRFRVMNDVEELEHALSYPWEKWTVFLHPAQRQLVEQAFSGPVRVSGSAGTGKTIVALHRAVHLARNNPDARVLLTTFSEILANALQTKLRLLISNTPRIAERLEVHAIDAIARRLYEFNIGKLQLAPDEVAHQLIAQIASKIEGHKFSPHFLFTEWEEVVDAWQLTTWEAYRDVVRLGRKTRLPEKQRAVLWSLFSEVRSALQGRNLMTHADMFSSLAEYFKNNQKPFDYAVVDEAQDISVAQLRFLASFSAGKPDCLMFTGDLGQRIFQQPFSWRALGIDIRGRSRTLRINYRTSHQIRMQADRLLAPELSDVDGNTEDRRGTISVFNGPSPAVKVLETADEESQVVASWVTQLTSEGLSPHEIGIFVRSDDQLDRACKAAENAKLPYKIIDHKMTISSGHIMIGTMHLAKGLEFRAVAVMACDDEVIPSQQRIERVTDDSDLEEVYNTERHLLYVACTRARDRLLITSADPSSEFLDDLSE
ncbi:3'-5' exonuclease [Desulfatitalea tepidiphila]|uniref:3'-5' exonuclease n=1 Tax=Desulfatitalea tepidiphila TaxID=1185843 RepID=UPI000AB78D04|nr:3'-5' exonuclease [Desulfatitalea tepidiphila]